MRKSIPEQTVQAFAKTICAEAERYGFSQIDLVRLINAMMDVSAAADAGDSAAPAELSSASAEMSVAGFPLKSKRLTIRPADPDDDKALLESWMADQYGRHFLLSSSTAQRMDLDRLLRNERNAVGMILNADDRPIGSVAFLDIDMLQKRAELRKLIGVPEARGMGIAEEATRLWIQYGGENLGLEKIYVSTLQTHLRNIQLNESIGFRVEGVLHREILIGGERHDVLRMGLCFNEFQAARQ
jgi:RimJ/RimL family protein N-acetyltransferase